MLTETGRSSVVLGEKLKYIRRAYFLAVLLLWSLLWALTYYVGGGLLLAVLLCWFVGIVAAALVAVVLQATFRILLKA